MPKGFAIEFKSIECFQTSTGKKDEYICILAPLSWVKRWSLP